MKKRVLLSLALVLSLATFLLPKAEAHHAPFCALDQFCVNACQDQCGGFNECFHYCIIPGCCLN